MAPAYHRTIVILCHNTVKLWYILRCHKTKLPWYHTTMVPQYCGNLALLLHTRRMATWYRGTHSCSMITTSVLQYHGIPGLWCMPWYPYTMVGTMISRMVPWRHRTAIPQGTMVSGYGAPWYVPKYHNIMVPLDSGRSIQVHNMKTPWHSRTLLPWYH